MSFNILSFICATEDSVASPIYEAIDTLGPYVLSVCAILSVFYGIVLGVKLAKSESADERKNCQKALINFCIGAGSILVLLSILYAIREYL